MKKESQVFKKTCDSFFITFLKALPRKCKTFGPDQSLLIWFQNHKSLAKNPFRHCQNLLWTNKRTIKGFKKLKLKLRKNIPKF